MSETPLNAEKVRTYRGHCLVKRDGRWYAHDGDTPWARRVAWYLTLDEAKSGIVDRLARKAAATADEQRERFEPKSTCGAVSYDHNSRATICEAAPTSWRWLERGADSRLTGACDRHVDESALRIVALEAALSSTPVKRDEND